MNYKNLLIYQMQVSPEPVFWVTRELVNGLPALPDVLKKCDDVVDAVDDWSQNRSPYNQPQT
jgi:hypothetical protein